MKIKCELCGHETTVSDDMGMCCMECGATFNEQVKSAALSKIHAEATKNAAKIKKAQERSKALTKNIVFSIPYIISLFVALSGVFILLSRSTRLNLDGSLTLILYITAGILAVAGITIGLLNHFKQVYFSLVYWSIAFAALLFFYELINYISYDKLPSILGLSASVSNTVAIIEVMVVMPLMLTVVGTYLLRAKGFFIGLAIGIAALVFLSKQFTSFESEIKWMTILLVLISALTIVIYTFSIRRLDTSLIPITAILGALLIAFTAFLVNQNPLIVQKIWTGKIQINSSATEEPINFIEEPFSHEVSTGDGSTLSLKETPLAGSAIVTRMAEGTDVRLLETGGEDTIDGIDGNWVRVGTEDGDEGWCFSGYLQELGDGE